MSGGSELAVAQLRLETKECDRFTLHLTSPLITDPIQIPGEGFSRLRTLYGEARDALEHYTLRGRLQLRQEPRVAAALLNQIRDLGRSALTTLVGPLWARPAWDLRRFFQTVSSGTPSGVTAAITVISPVDLPFEIMPALWDDRDIVGSSPIGLVEQTASRFLGLRFAIHRFGHSLRPSPNNLELRTNEIDGRCAVPLAPYWYEKIGKVHAELQAIAGFDHVTVRAPQPDRASVTEASPERHIAELLVRKRADREEIVHITAHCQAPRDLPAIEHAIVLGAARGPLRKLRKVPISVGALKGAEELTPKDEPDGPLAFISACGAADFQFTTPTSIPEAFLDAAYRTVVCPLVSVHVDPAMAIGLYFYDALGAHYTVGGALRSARVALLRDYGNPLGLAYCCHGDSRLRIATDP